MRILVVTISAPLPANNGQRLRNWAMLRSLAEEGHKVSLLVMERAGEAADYPGLQAVCEDIETIHFRWSELSTGSDYWGRLRSSFHKLPHSVRRFASPEIASRIAALLGSGRFDAAICEGCHAMVNFPERSPIPVILDNHNVEHLLLERYAERETNPAKRWYARAEASKMRRWDRSICARSAAILACSRFDRQHLLSLSPGSNIAVAPNVIDMDGYAAAEGDDGKTVVYVGGMDWFPNRDAVQHFAFDILPLLKKRVGDVRFLVAGRTGPADFASQFENVEGIEFTGTVDDIRPFIARSAACVVPLRIGSGTRLKILEEAAMAKAIVSTPLGAEGLELNHGSEILLASGAPEFAEATARLLKDAAVRQEMGQAARRKVEREYGLPALRASLRSVFLGMENRASSRKEVADDVAVV